VRSPIHRVRRFSLDLLWCAARGHAITGLDASVSGADPLLLVETSDGHRLHRCLRCLVWVEHPAPIRASGPAVTIDGVRIPARGRALRDAFVLRLIANDKGLHALLLALVGIALIFLSSNHAAAHDSFLRILVALSITRVGRHWYWGALPKHASAASTLNPDTGEQGQGLALRRRLPTALSVREAPPVPADLQPCD
jgi:hypothetical protein